MKPFFLNQSDQFEPRSLSGSLQFGGLALQARFISATADAEGLFTLQTPLTSHRSIQCFQEALNLGVPARVIMAEVRPEPSEACKGSGGRMLRLKPFRWTEVCVADPSATPVAREACLADPANPGSDAEAHDDGLSFAYKAEDAGEGGICPYVPGDEQDTFVAASKTNSSFLGEARVAGRLPKEIRLSIFASTVLLTEEELEFNAVESVLKRDGKPGGSDRKRRQQHLTRTLTQLTALTKQWRESADTSALALRERAAAIKSKVPVGGSGADDRQLSLVLTHGGSDPVGSGAAHHLPFSRVLFVHWLNPVTRIGKPVSLDARQCVVHIPNFVKNQEDFSAGEILHPAIGARMRKSRDREEVPAPIRRIRDMFCASYTPLTGLEEGEETCCFACSIGGRAFSEDGVEDGGRESSQSADMRCAFCLLPSHRDCQQSLMEDLKALQGNARASQALRAKMADFTRDMVPASLFQTLPRHS